MDTRIPPGAGTGEAHPPGPESRPAGQPTGAGRGPDDSPGRGQPGGAAQTGRQHAGEVRQQANELKDSAKQTARDAAERVKDGARDAADRVTSAAKEQASSLSRQATERAAAAVGQQKERAAAVADDLAGAVRRAAEKLRQEDDQNLAGYAEALADGTASVGRYLRDTDPRAMADHLADLARRRPEWVLGGAYVVGLAVARFLKANRPEGAAYGSYRHARAGGLESARDWDADAAGRGGGKVSAYPTGGLPTPAGAAGRTTGDAFGATPVPSPSPGTATAAPSGAPGHPAEAGPLGTGTNKSGTGTGGVAGTGALPVPPASPTHQKPEVC